MTRRLCYLCSSSVVLHPVRASFDEVLGSFEVLDSKRLNWGEKEFEVVVEAQAHCFGVRAVKVPQATAGSMVGGGNQAAASGGAGSLAISQGAPRNESSMSKSMMVLGHQVRAVPSMVRSVAVLQAVFCTSLQLSTKPTNWVQLADVATNMHVGQAANHVISVIFLGAAGGLAAKPIRGMRMALLGNAAACTVTELAVCPVALARAGPSLKWRIAWGLQGFAAASMVV